MTSAMALLGDEFTGEFVDRDSSGYEAARRGLIDVGAPAYVLRPRRVADVQAAVRFAAASGTPAAVRGGGHSLAGLSTNDGGTVIDLGQFRSVAVTDRDRGLFRAAGGATWGDVVDELSPRGLAVSAGDTRSVGVGGLTLGGGIGWLVRKHGLALDSLVGADVVIGTGEIVRASTTENPDLFWALRGGGGGSGVITSFDFLSYPVTEVCFGRLSFSLAEARPVLNGWARYMRAAPDEVTSTATAMSPAAGDRVDIHACIDAADPRLTARTLDALRSLGTVIDEHVAPMPYAAILEDGGPLPAGMRMAMRSGFMTEDAVDDALAVLAELAGSTPLPSFVALRSLGGAVARVAADVTAYAHRDAVILAVAGAAGPASMVEQARSPMDEHWNRLTPHLTGSYANFLSSAAEVADAYPQSVRRRLAAVRERFDPEGVFHDPSRIDGTASA